MKGQGEFQARIHFMQTKGVCGERGAGRKGNRKVKITLDDTASGDSRSNRRERRQAGAGFFMLAQAPLL